MSPGPTDSKVSSPIIIKVKITVKVKVNEVNEVSPMIVKVKVTVKVKVNEFDCSCFCV